MAAVTELGFAVAEEILPRQESGSAGEAVCHRPIVGGLRQKVSNTTGFSPLNVKSVRGFAAAWPSGVKCPVACCTIAVGPVLHCRLGSQSSIGEPVLPGSRQNAGTIAWSQTSSVRRPASSAEPHR